MTRSAFANLHAGKVAGIFLACAQFSPVMASGRTVHVHAGPGPGWAKRFEIPSGAHVKVGSCKTGWGHHDWCKVAWRGKNGFIHEGALKPSGKHAVVAPIVTDAPVKVRKAPGAAADVVARLDKGVQVDVAHCSRGWLEGWCRVNHNGHSGFVEASALRRE